jgi:lysophospholipase L1-like esterase
VKVVHKELPKSRISFIAIKPSLSRWRLSGKMAKTNALVRDACTKDERLDYIDIWQPMLGGNHKPKPDLFVRDGLHINDKGYSLWTTLVKPRLTEYR